jgi:large subunit ribosomal protein L10
MSLNLEQKKTVVAEVADVVARAHSVIAAHYRGLTVAQMTDLRAKARDSGVCLRVVPNTLARRAVQGTDFECLQEGLVGPLVLAFSLEDPGSGARLMKDFSKSHNKLEVQLVAFAGTLMGPSELDRLAEMPTREQALALLMATMKAPVTKLAMTLNAVPGKLVRTVEAVRQQKAAV